jgi:hypothetical protein
LRTIACTEASDETLAAVRRAFPDSALVHVALDAIDGLGVEAFPGSLIVDPGALTPSGIDKLALIKAGWPWLGVVALLPVTNDLARLAFELGRHGLTRCWSSGRKTTPIVSARLCPKPPLAP